MTYLLFSLLFVGALSAPDNLSNDNLLIEHSVSTDSANNAIQHLVPDLSKTNIMPRYCSCKFVM